MRILYLSAYLPGRGLHGGSSRIFEILHHLHLHHEIVLLTFMNRNDDDTRIQDLKQMCRKISIIPLPEKRPFYLFPYEPFIDYVSPEMENRLVKLIKKEKIDLVQFEYVQMGIYRKFIQRIPALLTEHEINFLAHRRNIPFIRNPLIKVKTYYNSLQMMKRELEVMQTMDQVICMNQFEADALNGYLPSEKLVVLPHGVDTSYFQPQPGQPVEPYTIGFFGAYHHYPNVDAVLHFVHDMFPHIKSRVPSAHLFVIGIHPPESLLALNSRADITVTGFVPDIRPYLSRCSVIIAPLRLGLGMRVKMLEAMAMGKALVATELACTGLEVTDGQDVIIAGNPGGFAESVCYLLQDQACAENLGREARRLVEERYNYTSIGQQLEEIYQRMVRNN